MVSQAAIPERLERGWLRRRTEHRLVAGVAGGLADWLNAPVAFVRFLFVVAVWGVPWAIFVYAGAALILPAGGRNRPDWDNLVGAARLGLIFSVPWLVVPSVALNQPLGGPTGVWIATYGLLGAGAAVLLSADYVRGRPRSPGEARATVLAALPVAGCAFLVAAGILLVPDVRWERVVPLVAIAGGAALLFAGRREFVAPAILALGAAVVVVASGARLEGGVGDLRLEPAGPRGEPIVARRAVGDVEIDLNRLRRSNDPISVEAHVGIGDVRVTVPTGARLEVDARVGRGTIHSSSIETRVVEGYRSEVQGYDQHVTHVHAGREGFAPVRVLAEVGSGQIDIYRGPP